MSDADEVLTREDALRAECRRIECINAHQAQEIERLTVELLAARAACEAWGNQVAKEREQLAAAQGRVKELEEDWRLEVRLHGQTNATLAAYADTVERARTLELHIRETCGVELNALSNMGIGFVEKAVKWYQATLAAREASYDRMRDNWSTAMQDAARLREELAEVKMQCGRNALSHMAEYQRAEAATQDAARLREALEKVLLMEASGRGGGAEEWHMKAWPKLYQEVITEAEALVWPAASDAQIQQAKERLKQWTEQAQRALKGA